MQQRHHGVQLTGAMAAISLPTTRCGGSAWVPLRARPVKACGAGGQLPGGGLVDPSTSPPRERHGETVVQHEATADRVSLSSTTMAANRASSRATTRQGSVSGELEKP